MGTVKTLMPLWHVMRGGLKWLLSDQFTTADPSPISSPRSCEPGPGTLTAVQTDGTLAIASMDLVFTAQSTPAWGDLGFHCTGQTRDSGLAVYAGLSLTTWEECGIGWHGAGAVVDPDSAEHSIQANTTDGRFDDENATPLITGLSTSTNYNLLQPLRSIGCHYVVGGKLLWVSNSGATSTLYPMFAGLDGAGSIDKLGVIDLPANGYTKWDTDFSDVTDSETNPANATTFNCNADFHGVSTHTHENTKYCGYYFRIQDATNYIYWIVDPTGGLEVTKVIDGATTNLYYGAGLVADGVVAEIDVVAEGSSVKVYLDKVLKTSLTVTDFQTEDGGTVATTLATNDFVLTTHPYPSLGIATDRIIAPQASDTGTHTADVVAVVRGVALPSAGSLQYELRKSGANEITLDLDSTGALLVNENADTRISGGAATVSDGDDIVVVLDGADSEAFAAGTSVGTYGSMAVLTGTTFNQASIGTAGATDSVELWPRNVSSLLPGSLV